MSTRTFPLRKQVFVIQTEPRRVLSDVDKECSSRKRGSKPWAFATGITPRSPWQNGHVERLIGSIRRECLDHVVVLGERHLRHLLANYAAYYNGGARTLHSTRIRRSIDPCRQSGVSHQSFGSAVSIGTMFGWHNR